jgi:hypothetical protein
VAQKSPQYPIAAVDEATLEKRRSVDSTPPPGLYAVPSFKFRHEIRAPVGSGDDAYYRANPHLKPRPPNSRQARRAAIRSGG